MTEAGVCWSGKEIKKHIRGAYLDPEKNLVIEFAHDDTDLMRSAVDILHISFLEGKVVEPLMRLLERRDGRKMYLHLPENIRVKEGDQIKIERLGEKGISAYPYVIQ